MNKLFTLLIFFAFVSVQILSAQTTYTTIGPGDINDDTKWSDGISNIAPPSPLPAGDFIVIDHAIDLNVNFTLDGTMTINPSGSLIGNRDLMIGTNSAMAGLVNDGVLSVGTLNLEGNNTTGDVNLPNIVNNNSITASNINIGNNNGFGSLTNTVSGTVNLSIGDLHLDAILVNQGDIFISAAKRLIVHGGTVRGGGSITACKVEFKENHGEPGKLLGQNICCDFSTLDEPIYKIQTGSSTLYFSLNDFVDPVNGEGISSADHFVDEFNYFSCNINSHGDPLPVELIEFRVKEDDQHNALVYWSTASELNNRHFVIERSIDGVHFDVLGVVQGMGTTSEIQHYSFIDRSPVYFAYYRLMQVDYDGAFEYSNIVAFEMKSFDKTSILAFPTLATDAVNLRFTTYETSKSILKIADSFGRLIYEEVIKSSQFLEHRKINLSEFENGIYNVILTDGYNYQTTHFIVMKY